MSKTDKSQEQQLGLLRDEIDSIDQQIQSLINQRGSPKQPAKAGWHSRRSTYGT
jgi:flagellar biosynthesis chaperone FliJ